MTLLQHHLLALILTAVFSGCLGIFVWLQNRNRWLNQLFAIHSFAIATWSSTEIFSTVLATSEAMGMFWLRIEHIAVFLLPPLIFHLAAVLLELKVRRFIQFGYILSAIFICLIPSPLLLPGQVQKFYVPFWLVPGPLYHVALLFFWTYVAATLLCLWYGYHHTKGARQLQIRCFFLGSLLGYVGGGSDFLLVYDIYVPWLFPYALYLVPIYKLITAYAILQHHLLEIHIVIRRSLFYSILITLLTAGYFASVYVIEWLFRTTLGYRSIGLSLVAFALMALVFQPLKFWIQRIVDWLVFRVPQEEIAKRMERLEEQALQAEKFKAISTLAAGMAHEIKNPLTALQTFAEFVPERHRDPVFAKKLHEVLTGETRRIRSIVQDVLDFAKPKPPSLRSIDVNRLIASTADLLSDRLIKGKIKWSIDCQHDGAALRADPDQFRQVLINLIQNAADAMSSGGTLTITTRHMDSHFELAISDTGQGIPKELLPKIFDPFVTTKPSGTGLGLSVVHSIIRSHRGTIRVDSHPGRGATFTVVLPL